MAVYKCKMCGGDLAITEGVSVVECEYCGTSQTVPTADSEKKMTLFGRANRLRMACEFDKAAGVYETIVAEFPTEAEAYWGLVLCKYGIEYVDDPATGKKVPTCHRSSFDSVMQDSDFEQACENADPIARRVYREEAKAIDLIQKGILEISGKEEPYDIFICYKETAEDGQRTVDSVIAQEVYDALTEKGYRVFFSRITLEDKLGTEYEPYIFAALNSAKVMLAFGTDYEHFNAVWVKNEWSRFLALIAAGQKKTLIPCYKGIDAYDMPQEFAHLQGQDMGKVGAIQDLLRGIEKILPRKQEPVKETAVVQQSSGGPTVDSLLKRGQMFLGDGDWTQADEYFDKVLDIDPECAEAYLGKFCAEHRYHDISVLASDAAFYTSTSNALIEKILEMAARGDIIKAIKYCREQTKADLAVAKSAVEKLIASNGRDVPALLSDGAQNETLDSTEGMERLPACAREDKRIQAAVAKYTIRPYLEQKEILSQFHAFDLQYSSVKRARQTELDRALQALETDRLFIRARKFAGPELAAQIDEVSTQVKAAFQKRLDEAVRDDQAAVEKIRQNYAQFLDHTEQKIAQKYEAAVQRRENDYQKACSEMESANTADAFKELHARFVSLDNYKDSAARAADCEQRNNEILAAEAERKAEEDRKAEAARKAAAEARAKRNKKIAIIAAPIAVVVIVCGIILSNMIKANQEEAARQEAYNAAVALVESGDYEDAVDAFEALGDYSDSAEQILNTKYAQALALRDEGSYDQAISILTDLGDFQDSAEQLQATQEVVRLQSQNETLYTEVIDLLERGLLPSEFNMALNKLREISPDYKDTTKINTSLSGAIEDIKALDGIYSYTRKWDGWTVTHSGTFSVSGDSWKYNAISKADNGRIEESNQQSGNMRWSFGWEAETESLTVRYDAEGYNIEDAVFSDAPPSLSMNDNGNLTLENSLWKRQ